MSISGEIVYFEFSQQLGMEIACRQEQQLENLVDRQKNNNNKPFVKCYANFIRNQCSKDKKIIILY